MLKTLLQSLGLSSLILVMNYGDLLGGGADVRMHVPYRLGGIVLAQIADILILGFVFFAILLLCKRTRFYSWVRVVLAILAPPYLIDRTQSLMPFVVRDGLVPILAFVWAALLLLLLTRFPRWFRQLLRLGDVVGIFFGVFALCSIFQLLWVALWKPGAQQNVAIWQKSAQPPRQHPLVVWIVFDELSFDQVFLHRAHDLNLPSFDALRAQSTLFTNVQPAGYKTVQILPSLLTGRIVDDFRFKFNNRFIVHNAGERGWHPLDGRGTIFRDARNRGWRTAAVGWYNPYCTIYGDSIDACYWNNFDRIDGLMSQRDNPLRNSYNSLRQVVDDTITPARADRDSCNFDVRQRLGTQLDLQQHAMQLLKTDQADFVFLHMSIPHSPNIWSRMDGAYTQHCDSSYLDNLALVDRTLGEILRTLTSSPRWPQTTLLVQGDHGWRIDLWNWLPAWTDEDDNASRGVFDPRPLVLIHHAGQTAPQTVSAEWPLLNIHQVLEDQLSSHAH